MPSGRTQLSHQYSTGNALGTLGAATTLLVATRIDASQFQGAKIAKVKGYVSWSAKTATEGPIIWGVCAGVSAAEVTEALLADPQRMDDPGESEKGNRKVFPIGIIPAASTSSSVALAENPPFIRNWRVPSWSMLEEEAFNLFFFNRDSGALTTGTLIEFGLSVVTRWLDD